MSKGRLGRQRDTMPTCTSKCNTPPKRGGDSYTRWRKGVVDALRCKRDPSKRRRRTRTQEQEKKRDEARTGVRSECKSKQPPVLGGTSSTSAPRERRRTRSTREVQSVSL